MSAPIISNIVGNTSANVHVTFVLTPLCIIGV